MNSLSNSNEFVSVYTVPCTFYRQRRHNAAWVMFVISFCHLFSEQRIISQVNYTMADAGATLLSRTRSPPFPVAPAATTIGTKTDEYLAKSLAKVATLGESGAIGIPTGAPASTGFRSAKHTPEEWHQSNYQRYYQSFTDRDNAERLRHESKQLSNETEALMQRTQADSTKKLAERMNDINFWKVELDREIKEMIEETDLLCGQKKRLENALDATEIPLKIAQDNLECRSRRQEVDLVGDRVELALNKVSMVALKDEEESCSQYCTSYDLHQLDGIGCLTSVF